MSVFEVIWPLAWPPVYGVLWSAVAWRFGSLVPRRTWFYLMWATTAGVIAVVALVAADWRAAATGTANLAVALACWWLSRRRRKRAPRAYGAKSRALLAAVVTKMRETLKPRPVLRPQPGGVS